MDNRFRYIFTDWEPKYFNHPDSEPGDGAMIRRCSAYCMEQVICSVPGVMTLEDWKSPNREAIIEAINKNLIESVTDLALEILGWE